MTHHCKYTVIYHRKVSRGRLRERAPPFSERGACGCVGFFGGSKSDGPGAALIQGFDPFPAAPVLFAAQWEANHHHTDPKHQRSSRTQRFACPARPCDSLLLTRLCTSSYLYSSTLYCSPVSPLLSPISFCFFHRLRGQLPAAVGQGNERYICCYQ